MSGQRREGVRLVSGARRAFGLSSDAGLHQRSVSAADARLDSSHPDMRCGAAVFAVKGSDRRLPAERTFGAGVECTDPRRGECRPRLDLGELARAGVRTASGAARSRGRARRYGRQGNAQPRRCPCAHCTTTDHRPAARGVAEGVHHTSGDVRQVTPDLRQNALDHNAEKTSAAVLRSRRRRRRRPQSQPAATQQAAGQRPGHHCRPSSRHPISRMEFVDEELHGRPRRGARACTHGPQRSTGARCCGSAEVVRGAHASVDEEPVGGRLGPRRRPVRQPLHRPDDGRGDRAPHLS